MQITIQKYFKPVNTDNSDNLLSPNVGTLNGCLLQDQIVFTRMLTDGEGMPAFTEEFTKEDEVELLKDGYFDLVFSTQMEERSWNGKNIYEFFNYGEPTETGREKYFIVVEITYERRYTGIIQIDTIKADEDEDRIEFTVNGIGKEIVDWLKSVPLTQIGWSGHNMIWETDYMQQHHFRDIGSRLTYVSQLDMRARVGLDLEVQYEIQNQLFDDGLNRGYNVWEGLKSFLLGWFIRIKFKFIGFDTSNRPRFQMILFWRSKGLNYAGEITKFKERKKGLHVSEAKWIFIPYSNFVESISDVDYFTGILFSRNARYINDPAIGSIEGFGTRFGFNSNRNVFQFIRNGVLTEIPAEKVTKINLPMHAQQWLAWTPGPGEGTTGYNLNIPYCRIVNQYFYILLSMVIHREAKYLVEGISGKRFLTHKCPDDKNFFAGSQATIDGKLYTCERITSYDFFTKDMQSEWIRS